MSSLLKRGLCRVPQKHTRKKERIKLTEGVWHYSLYVLIQCTIMILLQNVP